MSVTSLLIEGQLRLIAHEQLMAAIAETEGRGIDLVAVTQHHAVEQASKESCHRVCGTTAHTSIQHPVVMCVLQTTRYVTSIGRSIVSHQHRGVYS